MSGWNGSGSFTLPYSWEADLAAGIPITASRMDTQFATLSVQGFGNTLTRDGQGQPSANLPMNGYRHTGASPAVADNDYVIRLQLTGGTLTPLFSSVSITNPGTTSLQAVNYAQFASTKAATGQQIFPGGVIWKWGTGSTTSGTGLVTFGSSFPTACRQVQLTIASGVSPVSLHPVVVGTVTAANFTIYGDAAESVGFYWMAIGD